MSHFQGLKWGWVARVGDPAPFDLPGLYRVYSLVAVNHIKYHSECTKTPFSDLKKFLRRGNSTSDCRRDPASFLDHFNHWPL